MKHQYINTFLVDVEHPDLAQAGLRKLSARVSGSTFTAACRRLLLTLNDCGVGLADERWLAWGSAQSHLWPGEHVRAHFDPERRRRVVGGIALGGRIDDLDWLRESMLAVSQAAE